MKKIIFFSLAVSTMFFSVNAQEVNATKKAETVKTEVPLVSPKKPKEAECVAPAKPATPAEPAQAAAPATQAKPAEAAKAAEPAEPATPAPGTCPPEKSSEAAQPAA